MENPEFIRQVLAYYNEPLKPVPGTELTYISTDGTKLKFRYKDKINFTVAIRLLDLARSRHNQGKKVKLLWVQVNGNTSQYALRLVKAIIAQFP